MVDNNASCISKLTLVISVILFALTLSAIPPPYEYLIVRVVFDGAKPKAFVLVVSLLLVATILPLVTWRVFSK